MATPAARRGSAWWRERPEVRALVARNRGECAAHGRTAPPSLALRRVAADEAPLPGSAPRGHAAVILHQMPCRRLFTVPARIGPVSMRHRVVSASCRRAAGVVVVPAEPWTPSRLPGCDPSSTRPSVNSLHGCPGRRGRRPRVAGFWQLTACAPPRRVVGVAPERPHMRRRVYHEPPGRGSRSRETTTLLKGRGGPAGPPGKGTRGDYSSAKRLERRRMNVGISRSESMPPPRAALRRSSGR